MAGLKKDIKDLLKQLQSPPYRCTAKISASGKWIVHRPGYGTISVAQTPSDHRAMRNIRMDVRRYLGIRVD